MKKRLVRGLAMLLAVATTFGCVGCGGSEGSKGKNDAEVVNNCYTTGLPIAEETVTFTVMVKDDGGTGVDYDSLPINDWIKENMNIEIEWLVVPGDASVNQQATLAFTSGNMPDILMGMAPLGYDFYWDYILEGKVQDLTPYIKDYAPNVIKMFKEQPLAEYLCTGYDGNIYMLPNVRSYENDKGRFAGKLYINQTWLDNLGLEVPTTTKEFKDVLKAFRDNDPNGNGIQDEIPFDMAGDIPVGMYGPFGISVYKDMWYVDENDTVHYAPVEDNYRRALTYYRDLYQEGLIGDKLFEQSMSDIAKKINGTVSTVGCFVNDGISSLDTERAEEYVVVPPLSDELGNCTWTNQETESMWPEWFVVTSNCKYPEVAVRMADYFYSTEGTYTALYGPEGEDNLWYFNEDGKVVFTDPANKNIARYEYTPGPSMPYYMSDEFYALEYVEEDESKLDAKEIIHRRNIAVQMETYSKVVPEKSWPKVKQSLANMKTYKAIKQDIADMQWRIDFVKGTKSIENEWDTYIANLKKLGVDDMIRVQQESYDDYLKWLEQ